MLYAVACLWGSSERLIVSCACRARVVRLFCCTCAVVEVNVLNYDARLEFGKLQDQIFPFPSLPLRVTKVNNQQFNIDLLPVGKVFQLVKITGSESLASYICLQCTENCFFALSRFCFSKGFFRIVLNPQFFLF